MGNRGLRAQEKCGPTRQGSLKEHSAMKSRQLTMELERGAGISLSCSIRKLESLFLVLKCHMKEHSILAMMLTLPTFIHQSDGFFLRTRTSSGNKSLCTNLGQRKKIMPPTCFHFHGPFALFFWSFQQPLQSSCRNPSGQPDPI